MSGQIIYCGWTPGVTGYIFLYTYIRRAPVVHGQDIFIFMSNFMMGINLTLGAAYVLQVARFLIVKL